MVGAVIRQLNQALWQTAQFEYSATLFLAYLDPVLGVLQYVNAGHEPALLIRRRTGHVRRLERTGTVLGLSDRVVHGQRTFPLEAGDLLIVSSDGVTGELGPAGMLRLAERHREARASDMVRAILAASEGAAGDRTVVVVRFKGTESQKEAETEIIAA